MKNLFKKISAWLFGNKDSLSKECSKVYDELEEKYNSKEKITDKHLSKEEYLDSLSNEKKELLVDSKEEISNKLDKDIWKTYLNKKKGSDNGIDKPGKGETTFNIILKDKPITIEVKNAEEYVSKSMLVKGEDKPLEINSEKAKTIKQNKKRKYTKKK